MFPDTPDKNLWRKIVLLKPFIFACEVLCTTLRRFERVGAENLADMNIPIFWLAGTPGKSQSIAVISSLDKKNKTRLALIIEKPLLPHTPQTI